MPAYSEAYLADAMENLGEMADFATCELGLELSTFWNAFALSFEADQLAHGSVRHICGMSGAELALRVVEGAGLSVPRRALGTMQEACCVSGGVDVMQPGADYWCGWSIAYYQWETAHSFQLINSCVGMDTLKGMYPTFHEQSEQRVAEALDGMVVRACGCSRLKRQRELVGLSQSQLSRASGVGLRAIQQYEQGAKNINKAAAENLFSLAAALHCQPQDLLQPHDQYEYAVVRL